jgi:hypothetical protein
MSRSGGRKVGTERGSSTPSRRKVSRSRRSGRVIKPLSAQSVQPSGLVIAQIRLRVRDLFWTGRFTRVHPTLCVEVLNSSDVNSDISVGDHWITGHPPGVWGKEIASFPDVLSVDCLAEVGEGSLYRITFKTPPVVHLYQRLKLPLPLPIRIQAGFIYWEIVAREEDFRRVMTFVRTADPETRVTSVRRASLRDHLPMLSDTQKALLKRAMGEGYFAVPGRITLTHLARKLRRSRSSVSESLARIEQKLIESALKSAPIGARSSNVATGQDGHPAL